jgi:hypothetical protein
MTCPDHYGIIQLLKRILSMSIHNMKVLINFYDFSKYDKLA